MYHANIIPGTLMMIIIIMMIMMIVVNDGYDDGDGVPSNEKTSWVIKYS